MGADDDLEERLGQVDTTRRYRLRDLAADGCCTALFSSYLYGYYKGLEWMVQDMEWDLVGAVLPSYLFIAASTLPFLGKAYEAIEAALGVDQ